MDLNRVTRELPRRRLSIPSGSKLLPDRGPYRLRIKFPNSEGDRHYVFAFMAGVNYFTCSCPGCVNRGACKHLIEFGVSGRSSHAEAIAEADEMGLLAPRSLEDDLELLSARVLAGTSDQAHATEAARLRRSLDAPVEILLHFAEWSARTSGGVFDIFLEPEGSCPQPAKRARKRSQRTALAASGR